MEVRERDVRYDVDDQQVIEVVEEWSGGKRLGGWTTSPAPSA
jgi:hypothetical protein